MPKHSLTYSKFCIICNDNFIAMRINTYYCSKKCRNKARSLPTELLKSLIARNDKFMLNANNFSRSIVNNQNSNVTLRGDVDTKDDSLLRALALQELEKRKKEGTYDSRVIESHGTSNSSPSSGNGNSVGVSAVDEEMIAMKLEDNTDSVVVNNVVVEEEQPQRKGIRKL